MVQSLRISNILHLHFLFALLFRASAASCSIDREWASKVAFRSDRDVSAILPAPHCLLLSNTVEWVDVGFHYALDVRNGSMAWQWPAVPFDTSQVALQLRASTHPGRLYALVSYASEEQSPYTTAVLAALHAGNGTAIWQYKLSYHPAYSGQLRSAAAACRACSAGRATHPRSHSH